jgi:DNA-binding response OmpR family regulator
MGRRRRRDKSCVRSSGRLDAHRGRRIAMEPLDRELAKALADHHHPAPGPSRLLIVGRAAAAHPELAAALGAGPHDCAITTTLAEAGRIVSRERFDVVVVEDELADGPGLDLLPRVHAISPCTKCIVCAPNPRTARIIAAMRAGATDFIDIASCTVTEFIARVDDVIVKARRELDREDRIARLKKICHELNLARHEVSGQVDGLCNDLANAYQDISSQMNDVAMATEFRTLVRQELDVEDLLRTSLEYLLTKTGPTNAAVFLADHDKNFGLGAYVNYDCPRESVSVLLDHLCGAICPQMTEERDIVAFDDAEEFSQWVGIDSSIFGESQVLAFSCIHGGECLAVVVLFRSKSDPFEPELATTIDVLRTIFGQQLADVIRIHHRAVPAWPEDACDDETDLNDDYGFGYGGGIAA